MTCSPKFDEPSFLQDALVSVRSNALPPKVTMFYFRRRPMPFQRHDVTFMQLGKAAGHVKLHRSSCRSH